MGLVQSAPLAALAAQLQCRAGDTVCEYVLRTTGNELTAVFIGQVLTPALKVLLIVLLAYVATRLARRAIRSFVHQLSSEGMQRLRELRDTPGFGEIAPGDLVRASARTRTIGGVFNNVTTVAIWSLAALMILGVFNIALGPLLAGAGIAGVAIGFGAQDLVRDFLSGVFMLLEDQYGVGDIVDLGEVTGVVEAVGLRTTRVRDLEGSLWYIPNGEIHRVANMGQQWARSLLDIGVAYDTDLDHAMSVIKRVADELWRDHDWSRLVLEEPEVWGVQGFGPNEVLIRLVIKTAPLEQWAVGRELRRRLKRVFDEEGIEIPFPQRTVWLRSETGETGDAATRPQEDAQSHLTSAKQPGNGGDTPAS